MAARYGNSSHGAHKPINPTTKREPAKADSYLLFHKRVGLCVYGATLSLQLPLHLLLPCLPRHVLLTSLFAYAATGRALQNITLALPVGTSDRGTPGLLCTPTEWKDLISFYLFNYVAHAATVIIRPGERTLDFAATIIGSLLFPAIGLYRGVEAIFSGAILSKSDDLRKAAKSGALCMVIRSRNWRPVDGSGIGNAVIKRATEHGKDRTDAKDSKDDSDSGVQLIVYQPPWLLPKFGLPIYVRRQIIHGTHRLPLGYGFAILPADTHFGVPENSQSLKIEVAATYNTVKAVVALAQTAYASMTLYRSRGDQIEQFGFAAFGLTVAPYAVMSTINLLGNLCRPDYASLYMVESSIMDEARARGGIFEGMVARVEEDLRETCKCSHTFHEGQDVEDLVFSRDYESGVTMANFNTTTPLKHKSAADEELEEKASMSRCSSFTVKHSTKTRDAPKDMEYSGTDNQPLLLIPSCHFLKRGLTPRTTIADDATPSPKYPITGVALVKHHFFTKSRFYRTSVESPISPQSFRFRLLKYSVTFLISLMPLVINGVMSNFHSGTIPPSESSTWQNYTIQWLSFGMISGLWWVLDHECKDANEVQQKWVGPKARTCWYIISANPALGGFIVVGQMLWRYGDCVWVGG